MANRNEPINRDLAIEYIALRELVPDPGNVRKHSKKQLEKLAAAMRKFGFANPILIDEDNRIIAGHARREAAAYLSLELVPCVRIVGLTAAEKKALAIADNKLGDMSQFDIDGLRDVLIELDSLSMVEFTGFDTAELDILLEVPGVADQGANDPADTVPAIAVDAVSRTGDLWMLGEHRLYCGNALEEESYTQLLGNERADMVMSDPPFNVSISGHVSGLGKAKHREFAMASGEMNRAEFTRFLSNTIAHLIQFSEDGSLHYLFMDWRHMGELLEAGAAYTELKNLCVWDIRLGSGSTISQPRYGTLM